MSHYFINPQVNKRNVANSKSVAKTHIPVLKSSGVAKLQANRAQNVPPLSKSTAKLTVPKLKIAQVIKENRAISVGTAQNKVKKIQPSDQNKIITPQSVELQLAIIASSPGKDYFSVEGNSIRLNEDNSPDKSHDVFAFDKVLTDTKAEENDMSSFLLKVANNHQVTTALVFTERESFFAVKPNVLEAIIAQWLALSKSGESVQFGYCFAFDNQLYDLLNGNAKVDLASKGTEENYSRRKIFALEHILDLVKLGNLNSAFKQSDWKGKSRFHLYHFAINAANEMYKPGQQYSKHFFLVEAVNWEAREDSCETIKAIELCVRTRQRKQSPIPVENNVLTHFLKCSFTDDKSKLTFLYVLSPEQVGWKQTRSMLDFLQRLKVYGTENDVYGDTIIQKNQVLIANLKDSDEMSIYLDLMNNVSFLEKDLLEAHTQFNESTHKWREHHLGLKAMCSQSEEYDVDRYTEKLMQLLTEQYTQTGALLDSVHKLRTGLAQLKQSVNGSEHESSHFADSFPARYMASICSTAKRTLFP